MPCRCNADLLLCLLGLPSMERFLLFFALRWHLGFSSWLWRNANAGLVGINVLVTWFSWMEEKHRTRVFWLLDAHLSV